ncbi:MAG: hypothetical protein GX604_05515, partial [Actinobacteria bacterium]|nr:hypothetical protein [Actinomycetota bacterium]
MLLSAMLLLLLAFVAPDPGAANEDFGIEKGGLPEVDLEVNTLLVPTGVAVTMRLEGRLETPLAETELVVSVRGPGDPFGSVDDLPEVHVDRRFIGDLEGAVVVDVEIAPSWL